jgi:hypothetical protein
MTSNSDYLLSEAALLVARVHGLTAAEVQLMARNGAVVTHALGNRRYNDWVLMVDGLRVLAVNRFEIVEADSMARNRRLSEDAISFTRHR